MQFRASCRMIFIRAIIAAVFFLAVNSIAISETRIWKPDTGTDWYMENEYLIVTIKPSAGYISVYTKGNDKNWTQPGLVTHYPFTSVATYGLTNGLGFWTTFQDDSSGTFSAFVQIFLQPNSRNVQMTVNISDWNKSIGGFDFIEPFALTRTTSYLIAPDHGDGRMYPTSINSWPVFNLDACAVSALDMPWIGLFDLATGQGYSVIVDTPWDAMFKCRKLSGTRAPRVYWQPQKGKFGYSRSVTYSFTTNGGYVALAKAYRAYIQSQGGLVTLSAKAAENPNVKKLYGAAYFWDWYCSVPVKALKAAGVEECLYHGEIATSQVNEANAYGYLNEEYDSYVDAAPVDATHSTDSYFDICPDHFAKEQNGSLRFGWLSDVRGQMYRRCPEYFLPAAESVVPARLENLPMTARYMDVHTQNQSDTDGDIEECWDPNHPLTRTQWQQDHMKLFDYIKSLGLVLSGEHGRWWAIPDISVCYGIMGEGNWPWAGFGHPTTYGQTDYGSDGKVDASQWAAYETWGSVGHIYRVPLWELVFHDCAVTTYYLWDTNDWTSTMANDWYETKKDTLNILYGTPAVFFSNGPNVGGFTVNRKAFMESYRNACKVHQILADKEMLTHQFFTADRNVQKTTWSDGTSVIANFGTNDYLASVGNASKLLRQFGWSVLGPSIDASKSYSSDQARVITRIKLDGYYFSDEQLNNNIPVPLSIRRVNSNYIEAHIDKASSALTCVVAPDLVTSNWDFKRTRAFILDNSSAQRSRQIPFAVTYNSGIQFGPFTDWTALDIVSSIPKDDFDADNKTDLAFFTPGSPIRWKVYGSASGYVSGESVEWGDTQAGDIPVTGDYDGDGQADWIVYRPGNPGRWLIKTRIGNETAIEIGNSISIPVAGDFDCDGITDFGVCTDSSSMIWKILLSSSNYSTSKMITLGSSYSKGIPMPDDYDGDGKTDAAIFRPGSIGQFLISYSDSGLVASYNLGMTGDVPVSGDFDGDGKADIAACRPGSPMTWIFKLSSTGYSQLILSTWGDSAFGDTPVVGDFDGDGKNDLAFYRPGNPGQLYMKRSSDAGISVYSSGENGGSLIAQVHDVTAPVISSVSVSPTLAAPGDKVHVTVKVADNVGVSSVVVNGIVLLPSDSSTWKRDITASSIPGDHDADVVVSDLSGNTTRQTNAGYKTVQVVGTLSKSLADKAAINASGSFIFKVWGRATKLSSSLFSIDDSSGQPLNVVASGHTVSTGDFVSVRGVLDTNQSPMTLMSESKYVNIYAQ